jgi:cell shape-determining protein MreD
LADLFGHWYLGSHLLAITILSFFSAKFTNFYRMCNWFQRTVTANFFFMFLNAIIYAVELATHKVFNSWQGGVLELLVLMPIIQWCLDKVIHQRSSEFIFYG